MYPYSDKVRCLENNHGQENGILELFNRTGPLSHIALREFSGL